MTVDGARSITTRCARGRRRCCGSRRPCPTGSTASSTRVARRGAGTTRRRPAPEPRPDRRRGGGRARRRRAAIVVRSHPLGAAASARCRCGADESRGARSAAARRALARRLARDAAAAGGLRHERADAAPRGLVGRNRSHRPGAAASSTGSGRSTPATGCGASTGRCRCAPATLHVTSTYTDEDTQVVLRRRRHQRPRPARGHRRPADQPRPHRPGRRRAQPSTSCARRPGRPAHRRRGRGPRASAPARTHLRRVLDTLSLITPASERHDTGEHAVRGHRRRGGRHRAVAARRPRHGRRGGPAGFRD